MDEGVSPRVLARIYVVIFQERGLPHAYIMIILSEEDKPRRQKILDKLVSAELSGSDTYTILYDVWSMRCCTLDVSMRNEHAQ